jgi:hypothetical protein
MEALRLLEAPLLAKGSDAKIEDPKKGLTSEFLTVPGIDLLHSKVGGDIYPLCL